MDAEDEMVDLCLISQANHIESLLQQITALSMNMCELVNILGQQVNDLQQEYAQNDIEKEEPNGLENGDSVLLEKDNQIEALQSERDNLEKEITELRKQNEDLQLQINEDSDSHQNIQKQSVEQISQLGKENDRLREENDELKRKVAALQQQDQERSSPSETYYQELAQRDAEYKQLEELFHTTLKELNALKKEKETRLVSPLPEPDLSTKPGPTRMMVGDVDVNQLSESELKDLYLSEHNQVEVYTSYFHELNDIIDETLSKMISPDFKMQEDIATHDKLKYFIEVMTVEKKASTGNLDILRECEEWKQKTIELQTKFAKIQNENQYLISCIDCCEQYLDQLVGGNRGEPSNRLLVLNSRFEIVCRRSQKLMTEYQHLKQVTTSMNEELTKLRSSSIAYGCDSESLSQFMNVAQSLSEHMCIIPKNSKASLSELQVALQRIDSIATEQLPLLGKKLREFRNTIENERSMRRRLEERLSMYERRYYSCFHNKQYKE